MAVALVKLGTAATTLTPAFGQATAAGHLLVAWLFSNANNATDPYSTAAAGWAKAVSGGAAFNWVSIWYKPNCSASETAPVFTSAGGPSGIRTLLGEFSGVATSSPLDSSGSGTTFSGTQTQACAASDAAAGDLLIYLAGWNGGSGTTTLSTTMTDSSGASVTPATVQDTATSGFYYDFAWGACGPTGAGKDTATATLGVGATGSRAIASFLAAAGPGPGSAPFRPAPKAIRAALPQHQGQSLQIWQPGLIYVDSA